MGVRVAAGPLLFAPRVIGNNVRSTVYTGTSGAYPWGEQRR